MKFSFFKGKKLTPSFLPIYVFLILISSEVLAQSFSYSFDLNEVHYGGASGANYIPIHDDTGMLISAPHFTNTGLKLPVGFVSGTKPQVKAVLSTNCSTPFYVRATGPRVDGIFSAKIKFPSKLITPTGGSATYDFEPSDIVFIKDLIKCYDDFTLEWEISHDATTWKKIGESSNRVYVTHKMPDLSIIYHTVIDVSCHKAGGMSGTEKDIVQEIYDEAYEKPFIGGFPGVKRASDGHVLTYYVNAPPGPGCAADVLSMLDSGDGRCGAWAELFIQMIKVQGIKRSVNVLVAPKGTLVTPGLVPMSATSIAAAEAAVDAAFPTRTFREIPVKAYHFMVKKWGSVSNGDLIELPLGAGLSGIFGYEHAKSSKGVLGIPGQGDVPDPRSIFINHAIVRYSGDTYDPSYGSFYTGTNISDLEDASIDAVKGTIIKVDFGATVKWYFWIEKINTAGVAELQTVTP